MAKKLLLLRKIALTTTILVLHGIDIQVLMLRIQVVEYNQKRNALRDDNVKNVDVKRKREEGTTYKLQYSRGRSFIS